MTAVCVCVVCVLCVWSAYVIRVLQQQNNNKV